MNDFPRLKRELIAALDQGRAAALALVETIPPDLPVHEGSDWTARDLIIHLTALEADMITAMQRAIAGEAFSVDLRGQEDASALYELRRRERAHCSWEDLLRRVGARSRPAAWTGVGFSGRSECRSSFSTPFFVDYDLPRRGRRLWRARAASSGGDARGAGKAIAAEGQRGFSAPSVN